MQRETLVMNMFLFELNAQSWIFGESDCFHVDLIHKEDQVTSQYRHFS